MANLVMGAMGNLVPKLYELLKEEYKLQSGVKERISCLTQEFEAAQAALCKVAEVPWDQLDKQVQIWARQVREASYDMEDVLDTFLVRVHGPDSAEQEKSFLKTLKKMTNLFQKSKVRRKISGEVKDIISHLQEVTQRCRRYTVDDIVARPATASIVDPRLHAMYTQVNKLVGIDKSSSKLKSMLQLHDMSNTKLKIVSIVGTGGLGKTTLAKAVYDNLRGDFNSRAFVSVGRNPHLKQVLQMILIALDKERYQKFNFAVLQDITQFIDELREFLHDNTRYLIVIDDMWEEQSWENLKLAIPDDQNCEGRIIITTRNREVAKNADEVYELPPLPYGSSRKLLYTRIYGDELKEIDYQVPDEVSDKILRKCAGIPLAIITMASLLVHEPRARWFEIYKSIGFGSTDNKNNVMKKILSFSYYDLPSHLRTCLLYLSAFPEDCSIPKVQLVWMRVAEGFVQEQKGKGLFEIGEGYFNDLINRSLIQEEARHSWSVEHGRCRVHDMVLDFIRSMSHDENFFTVFDINDQGTPDPSNVVRRLAHHNRTMGNSNLATISDMSKVRSFIARVWKIDTWAPTSSFKLLRVLNIGDYHYRFSDHCDGLHVEHLGHLVHLRFLGVSGTRIKKFPEEMGSLKLLQTLDLSNSAILELPSSSSLPKELVCLRIYFDKDVRDAGMFSVGRLTSLEELFIFFNRKYPPGCLLKELRNLRELRVLKFNRIYMDDEEMQRDFIESLHHLDKLQELQILTRPSSLSFEADMEFVLPGDLRTLSLTCKLGKHCIDPSYHCKLSRLELFLEYMDEENLKTLGMLPELHFLFLNVRKMSSPVTIGNISDCDSWFFRKLRCLELEFLMMQLVVNKGDDGKKTVSFRIGYGIVDDGIIMPHSNSDSELQGDEKLQLLSVSDDAPPVSDEENKEGCISIREGEGARAAAPRFMPRLQVLHFSVSGKALRDPRYCSTLGLEFLSSLQEIHINMFGATSAQKEKLKDALRSAHPNHPTIHTL